MKMKKLYIVRGMNLIVIAIGIAVICTACKPGSKNISTEMATAVFVVGEVSVKKGDADYKPLIQGDTLTLHDIVRTGQKGIAVLQMEQVGTIRISEESTVRLSSVTKGLVELSVEKGEVFSKVTKLQKDQSYQVKTPTVVASVRGTEFLVIHKESSPADVQVYGGKVAVSMAIPKEKVKEVILEKGQGLVKKGPGMEKRLLNNKEKLILAKYAVYDYINNPAGKSKGEIDAILSDIKTREKAIDEKIKVIMDHEANIKPLDRLRNMGKPLTMLHLRDGSMIAGSVESATDKTMKLDTGDGVIEIPTAEILRRVPMK